MSAPGTDTTKAARRERWHFTRLIFFARLSFIWERLWPCLWQPLGVVGVFAGLSFMNILNQLPLGIHTGVVLCFLILLCVVSTRSFASFQTPNENEIVTWVERKNGAVDRPLSTLRDTLAGGEQNDLSQKIWQEHVARARKHTAIVTAPAPEPALARHDPFALRAVVILSLSVGLVVGHGQLGPRIHNAMVPTLGWTDTSVQVDVWVTPPAYTGQAPFFLSTASTSHTASPDQAPQEQTVHIIPVGSDVLVQVGSKREPALSLGNRTVPFEELGSGGFRADTHIGVADTGASQSELLVSTSGARPTRWPIKLVDDLPPVLDFIEEPSATNRGRLNVSYGAKDDYGLDRVSLRIVNPSITDAGDEQNVLRIDLPLPHANTVDVSSSVVRDLSEHEWAGLPVVVNLEAQDAIGQTGRSGTLTITLPERPFNHPVARKLVEFRKMLNAPDQQAVTSVISGLGELSLRPSDFNDDAIAFLVIRVARARLGHLDNKGDLKSVRQMLWDTALRIEDGEFAVAGRALSNAHEQLMDALKDGMYGDLIDELLDSLREAMDRFMAALTEQLAQKGLDSISDLPGMAFVDNADLMDMLENARELVRTGSVGAAQQMLEQLRAMLENVESAMNSDIPVEQYNAAREALEGLFNLTQDQEKLLDETFRHVRRGFDPREENTLGSQSDQQDVNRYMPYAGVQESLRQALRSLMPQLSRNSGLIPAPAIEAERSMQGSSRALMEDDGDASIVHQSDALDALRRMSEALAQQMARQLQGMPGNMGAAQGLIPSNGSDPFGRVQTDGTMSGNVEVPSEFETKRVQELFEELRMRSNDHNRPAVEKQYIERLLQPF